MDLKQTIAKYTEEALNMANRSQENLPVPEPEPIPENFSESKSEPKSKPKQNPKSKSQQSSKPKQLELKSKPEPEPTAVEDDFSFEGFENLLFTPNAEESEADSAGEESAEEPQTEMKEEEEERKKEEEERKKEEEERKEEEEKEEEGARENQESEHSPNDSEEAVVSEKVKITRAKPSFDDYIGRRNRSWERGVSSTPNYRNPNNSPKGKRA